jgi:peroxiredoxin
MLETGMPAPEFPSAAADQPRTLEGRPISLSRLTEQSVVVLVFLRGLG